MELSHAARTTKMHDSKLRADIDLFLSSPDIRHWRLASKELPLFIAPQSPHLHTLSGFTEWLSHHLHHIKALLAQTGAIVWRGFPVQDAQDFNLFLAQFAHYQPSYAGGATPRAKITGEVFEATQLDGALRIPLHQEMAYFKDYPGRIAFFCCKPAELGGETIIADMRRITREIPLTLVQRLETLGIRCVRNFSAPPPEGEVEQTGVHPDQRSWKFAFYTDDPAEVERHCTTKAMTPVWHDDGSLTVHNHFPAFAQHPLTGERIYRSVIHIGDPYDDQNRSRLSDSLNQTLEQLFSRQKTRTGVYLGDGTALFEDELNAFKSIYERNEIVWEWQAGDILLLDNLLVAHGRNPFSGTRNVQVGMLE